MEVVHSGFHAMHSSLHHGYDSDNFLGYNSSMTLLPRANVAQEENCAVGCSGG